MTFVCCHSCTLASRVCAVQTGNNSRGAQRAPPCTVAQGTLYTESPSSRDASAYNNFPSLERRLNTGLLLDGLPAPGPAVGLTYLLLRRRHGRLPLVLRDDVPIGSILVHHLGILAVLPIIALPLYLVLLSLLLQEASALGLNVPEDQGHDEAPGHLLGEFDLLGKAVRDENLRLPLDGVRRGGDADQDPREAEPHEVVREVGGAAVGVREASRIHEPLSVLIDHVSEAEGTEDLACIWSKAERDADQPQHDDGVEDLVHQEVEHVLGLLPVVLVDSHDPARVVDERLQHILRRLLAPQREGRGSAGRGLLPHRLPELRIHRSAQVGEVEKNPRLEEQLPHVHCLGFAKRCKIVEAHVVHGQPQQAAAADGDEDEARRIEKGGLRGELSVQGLRKPQDIVGCALDPLERVHLQHLPLRLHPRRFCSCRRLVLGRSRSSRGATGGTASNSRFVGLLLAAE
mmetsp:Transcript_118522/g.377784  ORF Transcript_118522/g.377784 Transcript_118522/m.377784 type:complete len:459 (+) Transcript_118522:36-1412(+)